MMGPTVSGGNPAHADAMALLTCAADPVASRERLEELNAATTEHTAAAAKATAAAQEADAKIAQAEAATAAVAKREHEFLQWKAVEEKRLQDADAAARRGEEANRSRAAELTARAEVLAKQTNRFQGMTQAARDFLAAIDKAGQ